MLPLLNYYTNLFLISLTAKHSSLYHPRDSVSLLDLHCLLVRAFNGHFLCLHAIRWHIFANHLPCDLVGNTERKYLFCDDSANVGYFDVVHIFECSLTFLTTMLPCSSVYFSSVTVCDGISGRSSACKKTKHILSIHVVLHSREQSTTSCFLLQKVF